MSNTSQFAHTALRRLSGHTCIFSGGLYRAVPVPTRDSAEFWERARSRTSDRNARRAGVTYEVCFWLASDVLFMASICSATSS